jgi:rod shape determining protein RodA
MAARAIPKGWRGTARAEDPAAPVRHIDVILVGAVLALACFGVLMVFSATRHRQDPSGLGHDYYYVEREAAFVVIGLVVMVVAAAIDYRVVRDFAGLIYAVMVMVLVAVISPLGSNSKGAQAWIQLGSFQLQPSELAKIGVIICLAAHLSSHRGEMDFRRLVTALAIVALPMLLIQAQPDLGTNLVFAFVLITMLVVAGVRARHLVLLGVLAVLGVVAVVQLGVLQKYQVDRLSSFVNPTAHVQGAAYNLDQSKTTIGSGGLLGKGLFKGEQTNLAYVPEQHTDFIFTAVGEQLGLVGSAGLLMLFAIVVWRLWRIASLAKDLSGTLICAGVLAMVVFQIFENVGMTMGIMPVTGIPLPFMSYGGSSAMATFAGMGLVLNVHMRRFR